MKINEKLVNILNWMIVYFILINFHPKGEPEAPICYVIKGEA
jgi:hypothetical protein